MLEDRFADLVSDLASLYESGKQASPEQRERMWEQIPAILNRAIAPKDRARLAGDPPPLGFTQTTWVEDVA